MASFAGHLFHDGLDLRHHLVHVEQQRCSFYLIPQRVVLTLSLYSVIEANKIEVQDGAESTPLTAPVSRDEEPV
jgi:hypothetical protein